MVIDSISTNDLFEYNCKKILTMKTLLTTLFILILTLNNLYSQEDQIFQQVEESGTFMGKDIQYFKDNFLVPKLIYPDSAKTNCIQGRIVVIFRVNEKGYIDTIIFHKTLAGGFESEIKRVIMLSSGMWTSGKQNGKNCRQMFSITLVFRLPDKDCPNNK